MAAWWTSSHDAVIATAVNELSHPWSRLSGVVLAAVIVFVLDTTVKSAWHQLWLPLGLAAAAYLMTRTPMAVAFAVFALAAANTDLAVNHWIPSIAYPGISAASLAVCGWIGINRFRRHIAATHDARWAERGQAGSGSAQDPMRRLDE